MKRICLVNRLKANKMKKISLFLVLLAFVIAGCAFNASAGNSPAGGEEMKPLKITINGQKFTAELYDNETAQKFMQLLQLSLTMKELNSNEKYCYLDTALPTNAQKPVKINAGDIMLFGNDCLVVFYKSFNTSYSYTRIGRIENTEHLAKAAGSSSAKIEFSL